MRALIIATLALAGCTGIVLGRAGPGRGSITMTNAHDYVYTSGPQSGTKFTRDDVIGDTYNTYVLAGLMGPSKSTLTGTPASTGLGVDAFAEFLHNTSGHLGFGGRAGFASAGGNDMSGVGYYGFPIMVEGAIGAHVPGDVDTERKLIGSISGLALSLHGSVGYVAGGSLSHAKASAPASGLAANLGLRLTLPITIVQFTLTAEVAYMASSTVPLEGVDTSFQSTSFLFGNIIAF